MLRQALQDRKATEQLQSETRSAASTWRDGKSGDAAAAQLLDHEPRPESVDVGRGCQRGRRVQQRLELADLKLELLPLPGRIAINDKMFCKEPLEASASALARQRLGLEHVQT